MDFITKVTRTITATGQDAIQKTKDLTGTARLNTQISEEENKVLGIYRQIGQLYVSLHRDSFEPQFEGMIKAIEQSEAKIKEYQKQVQTIKGTQTCPNCGESVNKTAIFCSSCGEKMPMVEELPKNIHFCTNCGEKLEPDMRFCMACGTPTESSELKHKMNDQDETKDGSIIEDQKEHLVEEKEEE